MPLKELVMLMLVPHGVLWSINIESLNNTLRNSERQLHNMMPTENARNKEIIESLLSASRFMAQEAKTLAVLSCLKSSLKI